MATQDVIYIKGNWENIHAIRLSAITMMVRTKSGFRVHLQGESFDVSMPEGEKIMSLLGWKIDK